MNDGYINGFIERKSGGRYEGKLIIDGIALQSIVGQYFKIEGETFLWLKRKRILEYDEKTQMYNQREANPKWQAYLKKQVADNAVAYYGEFTFMRFRYSITGVWDRFLGNDARKRLNLFVERLPKEKQTIINSINEFNRNEENGRRNK